MFLTHLLYASTAEGISEQEIKSILEKSKKNNKEKGISGMLVFNSKYFLQYIEGARSNINSLYNKIMNDERHSNILILKYKEVDERVFPEWSMEYLGESQINKSELFTYSTTGEFNPYNMTGESAFKLVKAVSLKVSK